MKKNKSFLLLLTLIFISQIICAQETLNSASIEEKSYQLYLNKNWKELIKYGETAEKNKFSYFYLQMRIGIAYYELKNYCEAEGHFKKALTFNNGDELAQEYLYYCYIYVGRYDDARKLSNQFNGGLTEKIGIENQSKIGMVLLEGGTKKTAEKTYYDEHLKTNSNFFNPAVYFQFGINHYIKNKFSLFHAATFFNQTTFVGKTTQLQYYLKGAVPLKNNWQISPAIHLLNTNTSTQTHTLILVPNRSFPPPPPGSPPQMIPTETTVTTNSQLSNYIASISLQKIIKKYTFSVGTTLSSSANNQQYINTASFAYSLFGNSKLIIGLNGYIHSNDSYKTTYGAANMFLYMQPTSKSFIKTNYLQNTGKNIIEENGYLVNNSVDFTSSRWSIMAGYNLTKHLSVYGLYQYENKKEVVQLFKYNYHVIVGGIKITP
jgi:tetratricopeptide (TPR) repeat protein